MRKSEPDHSDETNQFLTELEHDTKPDNSPHGDRTRQAQAKAGRNCTFHRKPPDIVLI